MDYTAGNEAARKGVQPMKQPPVEQMSSKDINREIARLRGEGSSGFFLIWDWTWVPPYDTWIKAGPLLDDMVRAGVFVDIDVVLRPDEEGEGILAIAGYLVRLIWGAEVFGKTLPDSIRRAWWAWKQWKTQKEQQNDNQA